jgi:hypothetical protein
MNEGMDSASNSSSKVLMRVIAGPRSRDRFLGGSWVTSRASRAVAGGVSGREDGIRTVETGSSLGGLLWRGELLGGGRIVADEARRSY